MDDVTRRLDTLEADLHATRRALSLMVRHPNMRRAEFEWLIRQLGERTAMEWEPGGDEEELRAGEAMLRLADFLAEALALEGALNRGDRPPE